MASYEERRQAVFGYMQASMPRLRYAVTRMYTETGLSAPEAAQAVAPTADASHAAQLSKIEQWLEKWSAAEITDQDLHPGYHDHLVTPFQAAR